MLYLIPTVLASLLPAPAADPCLATYRINMAAHERRRDECRAANPGSVECDREFNNNAAIEFVRLWQCQNPWPLPGGI